MACNKLLVVHGLHGMALEAACWITRHALEAACCTWCETWAMRARFTRHVLEVYTACIRSCLLYVV